MRHFWGSIRVRLLVLYVGVLVAGFVALALAAGEQIAAAARMDYEQRLKNEVLLIAQGVRSALLQNTARPERLQEFISAFQPPSGGSLTLLLINERGRMRRPPAQVELEVEAALQGDVIVVERTNVNGELSLNTAAMIAGLNAAFSTGVAHLSVPLANLNALVWQRWVSLWLVFAVIAALALLSAVILARSIIRPLDALRESAVRLSRGDLAHRVVCQGADEISAVARAFNEMARQVQTMIDEQRAFASNTSHELRTPLTTIRLRSEALRYDKQLDGETAQRYMIEIDDEVNRMGALLEDLTLLSRLDAGRAELGDSEIDFGHFAANLQQRMQPLAQAKGIHLEERIAADLPPVRASLNHLMIVFRNLLDNAIKYTPEGGSVTWTARVDATGLCSQIIDSGSGIEPDQLRHVFERFYRADKARSRDVPGSGLGLSIVKSVVEAYGGSVSIHSPGQDGGTTVTVRWPFRLSNDPTAGSSG